MTMGGGIFPVALPGEQAQISGRVASMRFATPGYFAAMGIPLRRGRDLQRDRHLRQPHGRHRQPVVRATATCRASIRSASASRSRIRSARSSASSATSACEAPSGWPSRRYTCPTARSTISRFRSSRPRTSLSAARLRRAHSFPSSARIVRAADPEQPVSNIETMGAIVTKQTESRTVQVRVLVAFAVVALILAAIGIHGLLAFSVSQRRHEIGVRMALGAEPSRIVQKHRQAERGAGSGGRRAGRGTGLRGGRAMESLLLGITPTDGLTFAVAAVLCSAMTLAGSLIPRSGRSGCRRPKFSGRIRPNFGQKLSSTIRAPSR